MKVLIICGGDGSRWKNYNNTEKHLVKINGEVLLERTIRQLKECNVKDISIIKEKGCSSYDYLGVPTLDIVRKNNVHGDIDKVLSSKQYWSESVRTILILGDVYFSDSAIKSIVKYDYRDWCQFGRLGPSRFTGKKWNENFAFSFYPEHISKIYNAGIKSFDLLSKKLIRRNTMAQFYRVMCGKDGRDADYRGQPQQNLGNFIVIDDITDDFDYPKDYEVMVKVLSNK